jgi:glycosyltransferase involved in cell wall biosynthesis
MNFISIIIPTFNRSHTLNLTLASILDQQTLKNLEVIIADNGSTDNTAQVCQSYIKDHPNIFKYIYEQEPGLLSGRHAGALAAKGDIVCFLDDDVSLSTGWLSGVKSAFSNPKIKLATGPCLPLYETAPPQWLDFFWDKFSTTGKFCTWLSLIDLGEKEIEILPVYVWGLNFCIRKETLFELGGFHPDNIPKRYQMFQGDGETGLAIKAHKMNMKALYCPHIKLHHHVSAERLTINYFEKRAFYQGVCDSFTQLRSNSENGRTFKRIGKIKQTIKNSIKALFTPNDVLKVKNAANKAYKNGFRYHQAAFKTNENVKEWVLKDNYWEYKLPC